MSRNLQFIYRRWFQVFIGGVLFFFICEQILKFTGNVYLVPFVVLLGAFIIPITFVVFFYGQERSIDKAVHRAGPRSMAAICFIVGGAVGITTAAFLEYVTLQKLTIPSLFLVALIEESAKLVLPIVVYILGRYHSEADGLLFGVASGMGFAALETTGYGFTTLITSHGDIGLLEEVLLIRGLLSTVGHAAWTGIVCATLWRQRERKAKLFNPRVFWVFILIIIFHALWDIVSFTNHAPIIFIGLMAIGSTSLVLLIRRLREAKHAS